MQPNSTIQVRLLFVDREANKGTITVNVRFSLSDEQLLAFINLIADRTQAISNASLVSTKTYRLYEVQNPSAPSLDSDVSKRVVLFYRKDGEYETISIPSPKSDIFESTGRLAGIRVDAALEELALYIGNAATTLAILCTPEGEAFPTEYVTGGLAT